LGLMLLCTREVAALSAAPTAHEVAGVLNSDSALAQKLAQTLIRSSADMVAPPRGHGLISCPAHFRLGTKLGPGCAIARGTIE
jgi:hypothetical protein